MFNEFLFSVCRIHSLLCVTRGSQMYLLNNHYNQSVRPIARTARPPCLSLCRWRFVFRLNMQILAQHTFPSSCFPWLSSTQPARLEMEHHSEINECGDGSWLYIRPHRLSFWKLNTQCAIALMRVNLFWLKNETVIADRHLCSCAVPLVVFSSLLKASRA